MFKEGVLNKAYIYENLSNLAAMNSGLEMDFLSLFPVLTINITLDLCYNNTIMILV